MSVTRCEQPDRHNKVKENTFHFLDFFYFFFVIFNNFQIFGFLGIKIKIKIKKRKQINNNKKKKQLN